MGLVVTAGFILQTSVFPGLVLAGVTPNIMLIITVTLGFMRGGKTGGLVGMYAGLLLDVHSGGLFGTFALIYMLLGFLGGLFNRIYYGDSIRLPILVIGGIDLLYGGIVYFFLFFLRHRGGPGFYFMNIMMPEMVYTVLVSLVMYFILFQFNIFLDNLDKRSSRRVA